MKKGMNQGLRRENRSVRAAALAGCLRLETGAHADVVLDRLLEDGEWDPRDARLLTEIFYGTLRYTLRIDHTLRRYLRQPLPAQRPAVRWALRLGVYQLLWLAVPGYAAVDEMVEAVKGWEPSAAPLVNAVLRRVEREGEAELPDEPVARLAVETALPPWLVQRWVQSRGFQAARERCQAFLQRPPLVLRVNEARLRREELLEHLCSAGLEAQPTRHSCLGVALPVGAVRKLPGYGEGWFQVQGEGPQLAVLALPPQEGATVADCCAGMGTKSLALLARPYRYRVFAFDLSAQRLKAMAAESRRLGLPLPERAVLDARRPPAELQGRFQAVLVDAPCTGLGLLSRHPEIRLRRRPSDIAACQKEETAIMMGASALVSEGGTLVYSVCTLEEEETRQVVEAFLRERSTFELDERFADGGMAWLEPGEVGEGFFLARFRRRGR